MSNKTADPIDAHVGMRIRATRMARGISQEKLAHGLGVTFQQVQKYEKGINRVGAGRLTRIAEVLGLPSAAAFLPVAKDASSNAADDGVKLALLVLTMPGGRALLEAYARIDDREDRHTVVRVAEALAITTASDVPFAKPIKLAATG